MWHILAQVDPSGLPTWLAGGGVFTIISGLLIRSELKRDACEKDFRQFIIQATERQYQAISTLEQALKVVEKIGAK